jgi:hypothetical protein
MPLEVPRHSTELHCEVYHNHTDCTEANNIEQKYFAWGTGNKRLCKHCEKLADYDAMAKKFIEEAKTIKRNPFAGMNAGGFGLAGGLFPFKK